MTEAVAAFDGRGLEIGRKVTRCRDCEHSAEGGWECDYFSMGYWDDAEGSKVVRRAYVAPDGFCAWGRER